MVKIFTIMKLLQKTRSLIKTVVYGGFFVSITSSSFALDVAKGKEIFNANCAACHKLDAKVVGPALRDVSSRRSKEWLNKWIRNSANLIKSGDADAVKVFEENNKVPMSAFPQLTDEDIDNIIAYTSEKKAAPAILPVSNNSQTNLNEGITNNIILGGLTIIMLVIVLMLFLVKKTIKRNSY